VKEEEKLMPLKHSDPFACPTEC